MTLRFFYFFFLISSKVSIQSTEVSSVRSCLITQTPPLVALLSNDVFPFADVANTWCSFVQLCACAAEGFAWHKPKSSKARWCLSEWQCFVPTFFFLFNPIYKRFNTCVGCVNSFLAFLHLLNALVYTHCSLRGRNCQHACCGDAPALPFYVWPQPAFFPPIKQSTVSFISCLLF